MGGRTQRETVLEKIRDTVNSKELRALGEKDGFEMNYCTFYPLYMKDIGFLSYHWYPWPDWDCKTKEIPIADIAMASETPEIMWQFLKKELSL